MFFINIVFEVEKTFVGVSNEKCIEQSHKKSIFNSAFIMKMNTHYAFMETLAPHYKLTIPKIKLSELIL